MVSLESLEGVSVAATRQKAGRSLHTLEKANAIQLVTLDRALGLRFLSLLECQLFTSLAPLELALTETDTSGKEIAEGHVPVSDAD